MDFYQKQLLEVQNKIENLKERHKELLRKKDRDEAKEFELSEYKDELSKLETEIKQWMAINSQSTRGLSLNNLLFDRE